MKGSGELDPSGATRDPSLSPQLVWLSSPPAVSDRLPFISHMSTSISIYNLSIYLSVCLFMRWGLAMLPRLVLIPWALGIFLLQFPKQPRLQARATTRGSIFPFKSPVLLHRVHPKDLSLTNAICSHPVSK
jgi:hypothetical protein